MKQIMAEIAVLFSYMRNIVLLLARLTIAYGFIVPVLLKIHNIEATARWFESMGIPFAFMTGVVVSGIETAGIVLLTLGLLTRFISLLLGCVMLGAIFFVHLPHGFSVATHGVEIPLYYLIFVMLFATFGPGKYSLDHWIFGEGNDA